MSYSISLSGHAADEATEQALITALETAIGDGTEFGVGSAQGFFQFAGTVNLLPTAPVVDPKQDLDAAVTKLDDLLSTISGTNPTDLTAAEGQEILDAVADVQTEVAAYEASVSTLVASSGNSPSSSSGSSTVSDGPTADDGASTSPTGTGTAEAPTLSTGERVAL